MGGASGVWTSLPVSTTGLSQGLASSDRQADRLLPPDA